MKSLMLAFILVGASQVFAATVELGKYKATDKDSKSVTAELELKAGNTATATITVPSISPVNCTGTYAVAGNKFTAKLTCNSALLAKPEVTIDITNVTPASVRSATGAEVLITIKDVIDEPTAFLLKKAD